MVMISKKIAIIGGSVWGNRGASAMLETTIHKLRDSAPDAQFFVFTPYPEKDKSLCTDPSLEFYDSKPLALIAYFIDSTWCWFTGKLGLKKVLKDGAGALTKSDLLLDIGGITFADGRLKFLPYNMLTIWPSLLHQVPVVKLSQAAGSFRNPILRVIARVFLSRCDHIFARGEKTLAYLEDLGLEADKLSFAADIAFSYQPEFCISKENDTAMKQLCDLLDQKIAEGQKIICISPSELVSRKMDSSQISYADLVIDLIKKGDHDGETYLLVPNASREGSKKHRNNDLHVIMELRNRAEIDLPERIYRKIIWVDYDLNTAGVDQIINRAHIVIASRFHAMVAALRSLKPTLIVGWGHKYKEVMKRFGLEEFVFDYQITTGAMLEKLSILMEREDSISRQIANAYKSERNASDIQFDYIAGKFLEN